MKHGSLFSGIGGFDLAAAWVGMENVFHCENNPFGQRVLKYYWPNATSYGDIRTTDFTIWRGIIDVLTGGFPCQGFSLAGLRLGTDDDRYLWPEYLRAIDECKPRIVVGENVTGILSMEDKSGVYRDVFAKVESRRVTRLCEIDDYEAVYTRQAKMLVNTICESLEERGYEVQTFAIPAASVQAPHIRERIWFVAYASGKGYQRGRPGEDRPAAGSRESEGVQREWLRYDAERTGGAANVADTRSEHLQTGGETGIETDSAEDRSGLYNRIERPGDIGAIADTICAGREKFDVTGLSGDPGHGAGRVIEAWDNWPTQSPVCDGDDGLSARLDGITFSKWRNESIKAGGNAVVPQVPFEIFKAIIAYEQNEQN